MGDQLPLPPGEGRGEGGSELPVRRWFTGETPVLRKTLPHIRIVFPLLIQRAYVSMPAE